MFGSRSDSQPTLSRSIQPNHASSQPVSSHVTPLHTRRGRRRPPHACTAPSTPPLSASGSAPLSPPAPRSSRRQPLSPSPPPAPLAAPSSRPPFTWQAPSALRQLERYRCGGRSCLTRQPRTGTKLARLESALDTSSAAAAVAPAVGVVDGSAATHRRRPCSWRRCGQRERRRRSRRPCVPAVAGGQASAPAFLPLAVVRRALLHSCRWRRSGELPFTVR